MKSTIGSQNLLKLSLQKFGRTIFLDVDILLKSGVELTEFGKILIVKVPSQELIADIQLEFERTQDEYISKKIPDANHFISSAPLYFSVWNDFNIVAIEKIIADRH